MFSASMSASVSASAAAVLRQGAALAEAWREQLLLTPHHGQRPRAAGPPGPPGPPPPSLREVPVQRWRGEVVRAEPARTVVGFQVAHAHAQARAV